MPKPIVVMKFGGTSVAEAEGRAAAIRRIRRVQDEGCAAVVVVSAMGRRGQPYATDTLLSLAPEGDAAGRDLLMSCGETISACVMASDLLEHGVRAVPMSGADARIRTDGAFGRAEITGMDVSAVAALLEEDAVPVITGFQGLGPDGRVTTLGRGGSDTSAVEIAGYLGAREALIFTDVPGGGGLRSAGRARGAVSAAAGQPRHRPAGRVRGQGDPSAGGGGGAEAPRAHPRAQHL
jgi:aspartate kinase